jgi:predicted ATPase/DNA-binding SARP family transcriptional activator
MAAKLEIHLLGDFHIFYNDKALDSFNSTRLQSTLTYLLLHGDSPQPRKRMAFLLWPDSSEASARNNLRQSIYQLRQALPDHERFLISDATTIYWKIDPDQFCDTWTLIKAMEQAQEAEKQQNDELQRYALEQASQVFHGLLLPGCYDEWIIPERDRIQAEGLSALHKLIGIQEKLRDYPAAILTGEALLRLDPLNENLYITLMRLHQSNFDHAGSLQVYKNAKKVLERELGILPGPDLQLAYDQTQRLSYTKSEWKTASIQPSKDLVGRQREWQRLQAAWELTLNESASIAIITGDAGIGKSRLAEEMAQWADQQGIITARAHTYGIEGQLPFSPITEWLRTDSFRAAYANLDSIWLEEISRLLPELRLSNPKLSIPGNISEYGQRQRFFEALARAIMSIRRPVLLVLDDLQWCDQETLEWLHFLLRFNPQEPLLILCTLRREEMHQSLTRLLQQFQTDRLLTQIELQPLDASETAKLANQISGASFDLPAVMRLYKETEGNPLFIIETIQAGFKNHNETSDSVASEISVPPILPTKVQAVILQRLALLSPIARKVVDIGAVFGKPFSANLVIAVGHLEEDELVLALDELWQKRIIAEWSPNTYEFTHEKLREVAYAEMSAPLRRLLHKRIAEAVEALYSGNLDPLIGQIAVHYDHAGLPEKAVPYYNAAGAAAAAIYANEEAIALLRRGLELLPFIPEGQNRDSHELSLLIALTPPYRLTKGWTAPELSQVLNRALVLCDRARQPIQRAQILYGLQSLYVVEGKLETVRTTYEEVRQIYLQSQGTLPPFSGLMVVGSRLHLGYIREARDGFDEIIASHQLEEIQNLQTSQGVNYLALAYSWNAHALWLLGLPETALEFGIKGTQIAHQYVQPFNQALTATYLATLYELCMNTEIFRRKADEALRLSQESHAPYYAQWAQILVQFARASDQPSIEQCSLLEELIQGFMATGARLRVPYFLSLLARAFLAARQAEKALETIDQSLIEAQKSQESCWTAELHRLRGVILMNTGNAALSTAEAEFISAIDIAKKQQALAFELRAATSLARLWLIQQRELDSRDLLLRILNRMTEGGNSIDVLDAESLITIYQ